MHVKEVIAATAVPYTTGPRQSTPGHTTRSTNRKDVSAANAVKWRGAFTMCTTLSQNALEEKEARRGGQLVLMMPFGLW